ncbi:MAG: FAD-dependent oxidoreductase [Opitutales bacterium]|nr:FAD-dependent oxidoreductase [Opitutales bacterium]
MPSLPIFRSVDLLITGGTVSGVFLALKAQQQGLEVALTSARPFLGEDVCADLDFSPSEKTRQQLQAVGVALPDRTPLTPRDWKVALENALVEKGLSFYFHSMPYALLGDGATKIGGALCTSRSGSFAIQAKLTIDASTEGYAQNLFPSASSPTPASSPIIRHRVLSGFAESDPEHPERVDWPVHYEFPVPEKDREALPDLYGREYQHSLRDWPSEAVAWHRLEAELRASRWQQGDFQTSDRLTLHWPERHTAVAMDTAWQDLTVTEGLLNLSLYKAPSDHWRVVWQDPDKALPLLDSLFPTLPIPANRPSDLTPLFGGETLPANTEVSQEFVAEGETDGPTLSFSYKNLPVLGRYDVLILGGGTAGASAAIGAARKGARTALVEGLPALGGVGTLGQIAKYWFGNQVGFTSEINDSVAEMEWDRRKRKGRGKGGWSVSAKSHWYLQTALDLEVDILFRTLPVAVTKEDNRITGLVVASPYGFGWIQAGCSVDATGSAEVAALAGAPTAVCGEDHLAVQGTGLAGVTPGKDYCNSDHSFSDETNLRDTVAFLYSTRRKFPNAFDIGQLIDSRERRQIIGEYRMQPVDILYDRTFPDTICRASSNFDSHGFTIHPLFMILPPTKERLWANVPFRCLLPQGLERVLSTGLGLSSHRDALPVIRMQADVQNQGYAAGRAAAISAQQNTDLRDLNLRELQEHLIEIGNLDPSVLEDGDSFPVSENEIQRVAEAESWSFKELALVFAEPKRLLPLLEKRYRDGNPDSELQAMMMRTFGLLGKTTAANDLYTYLQENDWDDGWNFRGMHQFGFSLSPVDTALIAFARSGDGRAAEQIAGKIRTLPESPYLSHARAICLSAEALTNAADRESLAPLLYEALGQDSFAGHALTSLQKAWESASEDPNDNEPRNLALREIYLARALFHCGDHQELGEKRLTTYTRDLRGHFSRHARFVLQKSLPPHAFTG